METVFPGIGIPILKMEWSWDTLFPSIQTMGHILKKIYIKALSTGNTQTKANMMKSWHYLTKLTSWGVFRNIDQCNFAAKLHPRYCCLISRSSFQNKTCILMIETPHITSKYLWSSHCMNMGHVISSKESYLPLMQTGYHDLLNRWTTLFCLVMHVCIGLLIDPRPHCQETGLNGFIDYR